MTARKRVGILISGRGSNMQALIAATRAPDYPAHVVVVISNRPEAPGLELARSAGIAAVAVDHKMFPSREAFDEAVEKVLLAHGVDLVCQAGFMRIQSAAFARRWHGRQLNIHPSLLPSFKGLHAQKQALEAGVRIAGCTVHFVTAELDAGPIVAQGAVAVHEGDTVDTLSARIVAVEHQIYPNALRLVASGAVRLDGDRVSIDNTVNQRGVLISPSQ